MRQLYQGSNYINYFRNTNYSYIKKISMKYISYFFIYDTIYMTIINFNILNLENSNKNASDRSKKYMKMRYQ